MRFSHASGLRPQSLNQSLSAAAAGHLVARPRRDHLSGESTRNNYMHTIAHDERWIDSVLAQRDSFSDCTVRDNDATLQL